MNTYLNTHMSLFAILLFGFLITFFTAFGAFPLHAQELTQELIQIIPQATPSLNTGNTAWILVSTALVLFMTLPGLGLFYGGLVQAKSVLSVLMHCFTICCVASLLWLFFVYSLAFGDGGGANAWIGGLNKAFLAGVNADSLAGDIPETVFFMFQMTFAIITPALIVGAYVERINFAAMVLFSIFFLIFIYAPVCHWVWGGGWLADLGVFDFAGGLVVHVTAGMSAIVIAMMIRSRINFPKHNHPPHSPGMTMTGAAMLWVGWYGFNAGSALAADGAAGMAMLVTHISAATASLVWMGIEWKQHGKPTLIGLVTGTIAGLATITPASGFVGPFGGFVIGVCAGLICYIAVSYFKVRLKIDDSLDVLAVHGIGGATGILLVSFLAATQFGGMGLPEGQSMLRQFSVQFTGLAAVAIWSGIVSVILVKVIDRFVGMTVNQDEELEGLDLVSHGEKAYEI